MLLLARKIGESVMIGEDIKLTVIAVSKRWVRVLLLFDSGISLYQTLYTATEACLKRV